MTDLEKPCLRARVVDLAAWCVAVGLLFWAGARFLQTACARVGWGFEMSYVENSILLGAARLADGLPYYAAPSPDFVAINFPPVYMWLISLGFRVFGAQYWIARVLSLVATLGTAALTCMLVRRMAGTWLLGVVAAAAFLQLYGVSGTAFDACQPDSVWLFLMTAALCLLVGGRTRRTLLGAAVLLVFAYFTKQTAVLYYPFVCIAVWLRARRAGYLLCGLLVAGTGLPFLLGHALTGGWFTFYTFALPLRHYAVASHLAPVLDRGMKYFRELLLLLIALPVVCHLKRQAFGPLLKAMPVWWFLAGLAATVRIRTLSGSHVHDELPLYYGSVLLGAWAAAELWRTLDAGRGRFWRVLVLAPIVYSMYVCNISLADRRPRAVDRAALAFLRERVARYVAEGANVWPTHHPFFMKKYFDRYAPDLLGLADLVRYDRGVIRDKQHWRGGKRLRRVLPAMHERLKAGYYGVIIKESRPLGSQDIDLIIDRYYKVTDRYWTSPEFVVAKGQPAPLYGLINRVMYPRVACRPVWAQPRDVAISWLASLRRRDAELSDSYWARTVVPRALSAEEKGRCLELLRAIDAGRATIRETAMGPERMDIVIVAERAGAATLRVAFSTRRAPGSERWELAAVRGLEKEPSVPAGR